jgi:hypothetical protein
MSASATCRRLYPRPPGRGRDLGGRCLCRGRLDPRSVAADRRRAAGPLDHQQRHPLERDTATGAVTWTAVPVDRDGQVFTGRFGARRDLGEGRALRLAAYSGFRPPTLNELHRPFRVGNDITEANAALQPEKLFGLEAGVSSQGPNHLVEATAFWNRIQDPIANVTIGVGPGDLPARRLRAGRRGAARATQHRRNQRRRSGGPRHSQVRARSTCARPCRSPTPASTAAARRRS